MVKKRDKSWRKGPTPARHNIIQLPLDQVSRDDLTKYADPQFSGFRYTSLSRLRRMAMANPVVRSFLQLAKNGVVGANPIRPTFASVSSERDRKAMERAWADFEAAPTVDGTTTMRQFQRALAEQFAVDGRVFGLLRYSDGYPMGLAVMPLPRECLADHHRDAAKRVAWGVQYDADGRVIAYVMYEDFLSNALTQRPLPRGGGSPFGNVVEVPLARILDLRNLNRADAWDGYESRLIAAMSGLAGLDEIDKITVKTMKAASCKMGFYERELGSPGGQIDGEEADPEGGAGDEDIPNRLAYGSIDELPAGWRFNTFDPAWPNVDAMGYRQQILRASIAAAGADYNSTVVDGNGVNYNSLRHFSLQVRDTWKEMQGDLIDCVLRPLLRRFLEFQVSTGRLRLGAHASLQEAFHTKFQTRAYPWVDPLKDSKAKLDQLGTGTISLQEIANESGRELQDVFQDFADAAALVDKIGKDKIELILKMFAGGGGGGTPPPPNPPEEGEGKEGEEEK